MSSNQDCHACGPKRSTSACRHVAMLLAMTVRFCVIATPNLIRVKQFLTLDTPLPLFQRDTREDFSLRVNILSLSFQFISPLNYILNCIEFRTNHEPRMAHGMVQGLTRWSRVPFFLSIV